MYDPQALLQAIDANKFQFMALSSLALLFNYVFFIGAAIVARRDRTYAFPLFICAFWMAHDVSYLIQFKTWFETYNHWYLKLFFVGLVVTTALEMIFVYQLFKYGKKETMPNASENTWRLYVAGGTIGAFVMWFSLREVLGDPLFAYSFGASGFLTPFFCLKLLLDRGNARGESYVAWLGYVGMQATWFTSTYLFWTDDFRQPHYVLLGVTCVVAGGVMAYFVRRMRPQGVATGAISPAPAAA